MARYASATRLTVVGLYVSVRSSNTCKTMQVHLMHPISFDIIVVLLDLDFVNLPNKPSFFVDLQMKPS